MSQGVTGTTIKLGIFVADFAGLQNVRGFSTGNPMIQANAVADYVNGRGGIAGRKVELVFAGYSATSNNWAADEQAVCTSFTEDNKVFAVIYSLVSLGKTLQPCLASHNTPLISSGGGPADQHVMDTYPNLLFYPGSLNMSRVAATYIDGLVAQGFFAPGAKIGLVRPDDDSFRRATDDVLKPRLAAHGLKLDQQAVVNAQTSVADTASSMPNVVLRFQGANVNRVLFLDNGTIGALFATQASSQGYFPKYGFNSTSNPNFFVNNVPPVALAGSMGVGWIPALDVDAQREATVGPAAATCYQIMAKAGQSGVDRSGVFAQRDYCDGIFFLKAALDTANDLTPAGLAGGADKLGSSYGSPQTLATAFAAGRHDGAASVRPFAFDGSCNCYRYAGPPRPIR
ncbi:MAG: ABC transporter substrate-binding protein [Acidimicrobiales bacterium]